MDDGITESLEYLVLELMRASLSVGIAISDPDGRLTYCLKDCLVCVVCCVWMQAVAI